MHPPRGEPLTAVFADVRVDIGSQCYVQFCTPAGESVHISTFRDPHIATKIIPRRSYQQPGGSVQQQAQSYYTARACRR